jgi:predicted nucleotidyltransferase
MFKELSLLKLFFESPTREFNVREIARLLKIAPATASKKLESLAKKGILKKRDERMLKLYKANLDNDFYHDLKIFHNMRKIKESGLLEELNKFYLKPAIVLFGSASQGLDIEESDIDLLVISEKTSKFSKIKEFEKKLNRKIQLFVVKNIRNLKNKHLINNIVNGILLQGQIKWI